MKIRILLVSGGEGVPWPVGSDARSLSPGVKMNVCDAHESASRASCEGIINQNNNGDNGTARIIIKRMKFIVLKFVLLFCACAIYEAYEKRHLCQHLFFFRVFSSFCAGRSNNDDCCRRTLTVANSAKRRHRPSTCMVFYNRVRSYHRGQK